MMTDSTYASVLDLAAGGLVLAAVLIVWRRELRAIVRVLAWQGSAIVIEIAYEYNRPEEGERHRLPIAVRRRTGRPQIQGRLRWVKTARETVQTVAVPKHQTNLAPPAPRLIVRRLDDRGIVRRLGRRQSTPPGQGTLELASATVPHDICTQPADFSAHDVAGHHCPFIRSDKLEGRRIA